MIHAGTVGAYLELDISGFTQNLLTAGQLLEKFRKDYDDGSGGPGGIGGSVLEGLTAPILAAGNAASEFAGSFSRMAQSVFSDAELTGGAVGGLAENFIGAASAAAGAFAGVPESTRVYVSDSLQGMKSELESGCPSLFAAAQSDGEGILGGIDSALGDSSESGGMRGAGRNAVVSLGNGMEDGKPGAVRTITGIMESMVTAAGLVSFTGVGSGIVSGIIRGMTSGTPRLVAAASGFVSNAVTAAKHTLGINSPSRVMMEVGRFTAEGMELGLRQGARGLYDAASAISAETAEALSGISARGVGFNGSHYSGYAGRLDRLDKLEKILEAVEKLADSHPTVEIDGRPFGRLVREFI